MLNIKLIPKKTLVLALIGCMLLPNVSPAKNIFGCDISLERDYHPARDLLNIRERPQALNINMDTSPLTVAFEGAAIPASRHHIIPFDILRLFFNAVVQSQDPLAQRTIARVLTQLTVDALSDQTYLHRTLTRDRIENAHRLAIRMQRGEFNMQTVSPTYFGESLGILMTLFSWMPGNIFIGPVGSLRGDDPGSGFEYASAPIIGQEQFDSLYGIYRRMVAYINGNDNTNNNLVDIVDRLNNLDNSQLHFYLETQWRRNTANGNERYYIFNNSNNRRLRNIDSVLEKPPIRQEDKYCLIATEIAIKELLVALL